MSLVGLLAECEGGEGTDLPGTIAGMESECQALASKVESLMSQRAELLSAFNGLFSGSEAAESRQSAAIIEAEIEIFVQRDSDLALQEIVLGQAIELYRERNQGPILGAGQESVRRAHQQRLCGLACRREREGRTNSCRRAQRGSLELDALSDGTVDSLYLVLRLAAVQEHNATLEPLPFVADDLLLNLDNARSLAASLKSGSGKELCAL